MLDSSHADAVAAAFGLGRPVALTGPVAHGRLGAVWRLESDRGRYAVKESRFVPDRDEVEQDAAYQSAFRAAGVPMPALVRAVDGSVLADVEGETLRVYEWVDVCSEDRGLDPVAVGTLLARLHRVHLPADGPVDEWYTASLGEDGWATLVRDLTAAGAPFAERLAALVPDVLAAESVLRAPTAVQVCHRDLWADNLRATADGGLVALDWENAGPADPAQELAMVLFEYALGDPARMRALHTAYVDAGGPGRLRDAGDFTMLLAQQGQITRVGCRRWIAATTDAERADNQAWVAEFLDDPVLLPRIEQMLAAVR